MVNTDINFSLYIYDRYNEPISKAQQLHSYLQNRFKSQLSSLEILKLPDIPTYEQTGMACRMLKDRHDVIIFSGNKYPDDNTIRPKFKQSLIDFNKVNSHDFMYAPLADFDKSDIIREYYSNGWEDILQRTHTCGNNTSEPCGECFNCKERIWAYEKLNISPDLGI